MYRHASPPKKRTAKHLLFAGIAIVALGAAWFGPGIKHTATEAPSAGEERGTLEQPAFDKKRYSITDPASMWVVVNKQRPLSPSSYVPTDLRAPAIPLRDAKTSENMQVRDATATALEQLVQAANAEGIKLLLASGYRSYKTQVSVYASEVKAYGQAKADQESARPGYSEHQSGFAADLGAVSKKCEIQACFAGTPEGAWLAANAYKYGFIIRYPQDKTSITGYTYEPWHVRFIGKELAAELHAKGVATLEEFFGLAAAPGY